MITWNNVYQFLEGNIKMLGDKLDMLPIHIKEQVLFRSKKCENDCMKLGYCVHCGCDVPGKLYVKESCNNGSRFPDLMEKEDWEKYKKENNITFDGDICRY
jgi:hypothetical protein